jgi:hypothetical protein
MGNDKKDLTGILDLQRLQAEDPSAVVENTEQDPFALNELQAIEQVDDFASIDQIGMMDHPTEEPTTEPTADLIDGDNFNPSESITNDSALSEPASVTDDPFAVSEVANQDDPFAVSTDFNTPMETAPDLDSNPESIPESSAAPIAFDAPSFSIQSHTTDSSDSDLSTAEPFQPIAPPPAVPSPSLDQVKRYSEKTSGITGSHSKIFYPFHLRIHGHCGPYERDKLFLFLSENPIGLSTSELDLQIQAGKIFFPRISEFSAVKLIQELRDSGLSFQLNPSDQDEAVVTREAPRTFHYQNPSFAESGSPDQEIPILNENSKPDAPYQELEEVSVTQFVRTDLIEVENSAIIQEVIERMTEALKQKARIKGGNALMYLKREITPLRLPSQYQISLKANVIRLP